MRSQTAPTGSFLICTRTTGGLLLSSVRTQQGRFEQVDWLLAASVPSGFLNFDEFIYLPNQNYPECGWSGWWQRLRRWAYLRQ
ncbi:MAG: hypothetical protein ABIP94_03545 [Planctomycetota bacterium]